jgi:hypothetical protein
MTWSNLHPPMQWTESDFDTMSWHDNHVHGIRVEQDNPEHGTGILTLDLDYILEWIRTENGTFRFRVIPARLTFREVSGLRIEVDWAAASAGMTPFSIGSIDRKRLEYPTGHTSFSWTIQIDWPIGSITFDSPGFRQVTFGSEVITADQCLNPDRRSDR